MEQDQDVHRAWYYHPKGLDFDGNCGPSADQPGWSVVVAETANEALAKLPRAAQRKIKSFMKNLQKKEKGDYTDLEACMEATCGWGVGFSFLTDVDWEALLEDLQEEEQAGRPA